MKLFFDADGAVKTQCLDSDGNGTLDVRYRLSGGAVIEGLVDSNGDGKGDVQPGLRRRQGRAPRGRHEQGRPPGRGAVPERLSNVVRQCQDDNYDGSVDTCFEGEKVVPVSGVKELSEPLGALGCGGFDAFWKRR